MAKVREILRMLKNDGWKLDHAVGSHHQFKHPTKPGTVTVAFANGNEGIDIPTGTLRSIYRQAGWEWKR